MPTLIFFNVQPHKAAAISSFLGVAIGICGAMSYFFLRSEITDPKLLGYVDKQAFLGIVFGAIIGAPLGVNIAHKASPPLLKKIFGIVLGVVSLKMIVDSFHT